jgi:hypothetical protein
MQQCRAEITAFLGTYYGVSADVVRLVWQFLGMSMDGDADASAPTSHIALRRDVVGAQNNATVPRVRFKTCAPMRVCVHDALCISAAEGPALGFFLPDTSNDGTAFQLWVNLNGRCRCKPQHVLAACVQAARHARAAYGVCITHLVVRNLQISSDLDGANSANAADTLVALRVLLHDLRDMLTTVTLETLQAILPPQGLQYCLEDVAAVGHFIVLQTVYVRDVNLQLDTVQTQSPSQSPQIIVI